MAEIIWIQGKYPVFWGKRENAKQKDTEKRVKAEGGVGCISPEGDAAGGELPQPAVPEGIESEI